MSVFKVKAIQSLQAEFSVPGDKSMSHRAAILGGLVFGYYGPNLYISNIAQKRRDSIVQAFPDALDQALAWWDHEESVADHAMQTRTA